MIRCTYVVAVLLAATSAPALSAPDNKADTPFAQKATWKAPSLESVHQLALEWLEERNPPPEIQAATAALWAQAADAASGVTAFDALCGTFALADPHAVKLMATLGEPRTSVALPDVLWLEEGDVPPLQRANLRLAYARWLVHESLYEEALTQIAELKPEEVVDPAGLLFYQAVGYQRTLARDRGLSAIARLLENEDTLPKRFVSVARLMQADLEPLKDDSLDHIARRMDDVRRRLDLGRAGPKVREVEDGVIASLDKLIKKIEEQQQAAAAAAAQSGGGATPSAPLPDSMPVEQKGPGEVAKKPIGNSSGWGNLPAKDRQEALQQIGNDFPAHYRDMIEQYFRKLASEREEEVRK
ncbi:MAG TPA: hypothetical protein VL175_15910 [Pirellulales bacterium]|jgi:hypothetical protein|nr:hypothetical protein [Pirellulales bacterium]